MIFEQVAQGGCQSYLVGCAKTRAAVLIDPEVRQHDRYKSLVDAHGLTVAYVIDTHTHADHFSATKELSQFFGAKVVMSQHAPEPFADIRLKEGEELKFGKLKLKALATPGHTRDSMCLVIEDRVFTGDTLLIGGTGRTDLPTGDPEALYESLFNKLLKLDRKLLVYPAHDYKGRSCSTIGDEIDNNPRLQKRERGEFVEMMRSLSLSMPEHLTEALRVNLSGAKSVAQMLNEAAATVPLYSIDELKTGLDKASDLVVVDVRERDAYEVAHIPGARHLPRGQLELRVNQAFPDPNVRIVTYCEVGKISTLAAATLKQMGFPNVMGLDAGIKSWIERGYPTESGPAPAA
jgi:glyoxylase-like metal-dependent hydrolase (beta-lactamase superfamily II)/rhodanese-related sulfurtransferase